MNGLMIAAIAVPVIAGLGIYAIPKQKENVDEIAARVSIGAIALTLVIAAVIVVQALGGREFSMTLFSFTENISASLKLDNMGCFFLAFIVPIWLLAGIFSTEYLHHETARRRFWCFYLITLSAMIGLCMAGNLVTLYLFFEMMTLGSMPLVLHTQTHESIMAGLKYLLYSMAGAYMALFGVFFFYSLGGELSFLPGGVISAGMLKSNGTLALLAVFLMILGFGVKAGMFPMHAWLPTAHPVAPAPASAVLSALIVKGGVLAIIRTVYYVVGPSFIKGTWVQKTWLCLAIFTVFTGSMLAFNEKVLKKRLAYSSVSQLSYILLGLAILTPTAVTGALLHTLFHAMIKTVLFLGVGAIIFKTGRSRADEIRGVGKEMPITIWCFTFASLGLIGIPPAGGFVSKWFLGSGLLESGMKPYAVLGVAVLLVSAILTAGYLLPISIKGFLPGADYDYSKLEKKEPTWRMTVPMIILAALIMIGGMFPTQLINFLQGIAGTLF